MTDRFDLQFTSSKRSTNTTKFLNEAAKEAVLAAEELEKTNREEARDKTFIPNMRARQSTAIVTDKQVASKAAVKNATSMVVAKIVMESMPIDISHVGLDELREQIEAVLNDTLSNIVDTSLFEGTVHLHSPMVKQLDSAESIKNYLEINDASGNATSLLRKVVSVIARDQYKGGKTTTNATLYNNMSIVAKADEPKTPEDMKNLSSFINDTSTNITGVYSKFIKEKCRVNLSKDMKDKSITEADQYSGLSETVIAIRKGKERKKNLNSSIGQELFKTISVMQESHGATANDYLNEAFFQMCILETYKLLECVTLNDADIAFELRNKRAKFSN